MAGAGSVGSDYFNDLLQQPPSGFPPSRSHHSSDQLASGQNVGGDNKQNEEENGQVPRPKRIACVVCRKRKLRCDGKRPSCGTCSRLGHDCAYDEVRRKSGPKRGYVKQLEARLAQVETLLKSQEPSEKVPSPEAPPQNNPPKPSNPPTSDIPFHPMPDLSELADGMEGVTSLPLNNSFGDSQQNIPPMHDPTLGIGEEFSWEMIGLGLEEPLPNQDVIDDLHQIYFEKIHPSVPIIHRPRYLAAMNLAPSMRPPVCLRYIIWCHAASITDKYISLQKLFYQRSRKYIEMDSLKGQGEAIVSVAYAQTWILLASYEFKHMSFPRAWMSTGNSSRLAIMTGLHRQDGLTCDVKQSLHSARDWTEKEERRRTFWMAFCQDRYASIGTGWPMVIDEKDILTNLPASDDAFLNGTAQETLPLSEVMAGQCSSSLSPLAGVVLMACLFGRNLTHLHRVGPGDDDHDINGEFWKRHRALDNVLLSTSLSLPDNLRLPAGVGDANVVFLNMNIHTSTICLHQAAIFKADKSRIPAQYITDCKRRCMVSADQITSIMKMISHTDLSALNPFTVFCLYVACRVYIQHLKSHPSDESVLSSLRFLLSAMNAFKAKNPLTESFLVQLDVDLEGSGLECPENISKFCYSLQKGVQELGPDDDPDDRRSPLKYCLPKMKDGHISPDPCGQTPDHTDPIFLCPDSIPRRPKQEDASRLYPSSQAVDIMTLPGVIPTQPNHPSTSSNDHVVPNMMETGSSGVSPNSDRQQILSDQTTPSTQQSSVNNNSFTPPGVPSPQKQQQEQQQEKTRQPQKRPYDILSADVYPSNPNSQTSTSVPPPSTTAYFTNSNNSSNSDSFAPTFSTAQELPIDLIEAPNPFVMHAAWQYRSAGTDNVSLGGNMSQTMLGGGGGGGGGTGLGVDSANDGSWDQLLSSMGWNEWQQSSGSESFSR